MKPAKNPKLKATHDKQPIKNKHSGSGKPKGLFVYLAIIFLYGFIIYGQSIKFEFAMDDNIMIKLNKSVQKGTSGIGELFTKSMVFGSNGKNDGAYRPLTMISFAIDKQLFGNKPAPFHFINVLLYSLTGVLVFQLLRKMFSSWNLFFPFLITMLFMAHPIHTEVVANIKSRDELLSFLFAIWSLVYLLKTAKKNNTQHMAITFVLFLLACLSKETALTFVIIAPLTLFFFSKQNGGQLIKNALPFFAGAVLYMILRTTFLDSIGSGSQIKIIDNTLMAATTAGEKYATIIFITWKYLWLLIFPHPLSWDYSFKQIPISSFSEIRTILPLLLFIAFAVVAAITLQKKNIFSWCIIFFFATLALVSNIFIPIAATMAERFLFFPSFAFCVALITMLVYLFKTDTRLFNPQKNIPFLSVCSLLILLYSAKSYARTGDWKNNLTLFESGVISAPNSSRTHSSLAYEYAVQAEKSTSETEKKSYFIKSIESFKKALAIYEGNKEGWYNIAHTYDIMSDYAHAAEYYKLAIQHDSSSANAYNNLGAIYLRENKYDQAKALFNSAILLDKNYADPLGNMGAAFHFENNYGEAIRYYEMALRVNPTLETVINNIAKAKQGLAEQQRLSPNK